MAADFLHRDSCATLASMTNNDVLRSIRYMLNVDDHVLASIVHLGGGEVSTASVRAFLEHDDQPDYQPCGDLVMSQFLDGLIVHRRGRQESGKPAPPLGPMTNNTVLKKLRVAFELKEDDLIAIMTAAGFAVSRPELSALFRSPTHHNYRPCGDQFLRNFLKSLTARVRG
jgi:uncharacterized protein YehS (DUF1456 family)